MPSSIVRCVCWRMRYPIAAPTPSTRRATATKMPIAKYGRVVGFWVIQLAIGGAITAPRKRPATSPAMAKATPLRPRRSPEIANAIRNTMMTTSRMSIGRRVCGCGPVRGRLLPGYRPERDSRVEPVRRCMRGSRPLLRADTSPRRSPTSASMPRYGHGRRRSAGMYSSPGPHWPCRRRASFRRR